MDKLNITQVAFRRKFNLGNYETFDVELVATIGPGQDTKDVLAALDKVTMDFKKSRGVSAPAS